MPRKIGHFLLLCLFSVSVVSADLSKASDHSEVSAQHLEENLPILAPLPLLPLKQSIPLEMDEANRQFQETIQRKEPIYNQKIFYEHSLPWLEILILTLFGLWALMWYLYPVVSKPVERPEKKLARLQQEALLTIKQLDKKSLPVDQVYLELSHLIRQYMKKRYELNAPEITTQEFIKELQVSPLLSQESKKNLAQFLFEADQVKFAQYQPPEQEIKNSYKVVQEIISQ